MRAVVVAYDVQRARRGGSRAVPRNVPSSCGRTGAPRRGRTGLATTTSRRPSANRSAVLPQCQTPRTSRDRGRARRAPAPTAPAAVPSAVLERLEQVDATARAAHPGRCALAAPPPPYVGRGRRSSPARKPGIEPVWPTSIPDPPRHSWKPSPCARRRAPRPGQPTAGWTSPRASPRQHVGVPGEQEGARSVARSVDRAPHLAGRRHRAGVVARLRGQRARRSGARCSPVACGASRQVGRAGHPERREDPRAAPASHHGSPAEPGDDLAEQREGEVACSGRCAPASKRRRRVVERGGQLVEARRPGLRSHHEPGRLGVHARSRARAGPQRSGRRRPASGRCVAERVVEVEQALVAAAAAPAPRSGSW